jgi:hypothetical protein
LSSSEPEALRDSRPLCPEGILGFKRGIRTAAISPIERVRVLSVEHTVLFGHSILVLEDERLIVLEIVECLRTASAAVFIAPTGH